MENKLSVVQESLQKEKTCCEQLLTKMKEQINAVGREDDAELSRIIEKKNALIETIQEIERTLAAALENLSDEERAQVARIAEGTGKDIESLLERILELENACRKDLEERKLTIQNKLVELKQGKTVLRGYSTPPRKKPLISKNI